MAGILWADSNYGLLAFIVVTGLGAAAAFATGRALASGWSPLWRIAPAMVALAAAVQFLHFALFQEELLSLHYYLVTFVLLLAVAWVGYTAMRARQMATQYSWAFEKVGLSWRAR
jgi:NO-binding membrane sensor protein with MHYT domain